MIPLEEARAYVLSLAEPLGIRQVPLDGALGLVLAEAIVAGESVPPFANTAMDGFAVRAADTAPGAGLRVVGTVAAGSVFDGEIGPGEAVRIMTGAPMPAGSDAVVMVELTSTEGDEVVVGRAVPVGNHVRPAGDDMSPGDLVAEAGIEITPGVLGLLATLGRADVAVIRRPRVGVISTGDELVDGPGPLGRGQIRDSNRRAVLALVSEMGAEGVDLGLIRDHEASIEAALLGATAECDLVLSSGGVSMGDFDFVKVVLDRIGEMRWMQVAIRPAKPLAVGRVLDTPIIGLPGNPVSSMISFELFARPAIRAMGGHRQLDRPRLLARAAADFERSADGKVHVVRALLEQSPDHRWSVRPLRGQGSHHISSMAVATGLVVLPDGEGAAAGEDVVVVPLA